MIQRPLIVIPLIILIFLVPYSYYYFFVGTLTISEIVGSTNNPTADILVNFFDFDTGLTRYDIYHLKSKSDYWNMRMREVSSMQDPQVRAIENEKLMAEMMRDPSMKKIVRKIFAFGGKSVMAILEAIKTYKFLKM